MLSAAHRPFLRAGSRTLRRLGAAWLSSVPGEPRRVCIVGSGPSGFYTAKYLLKDAPEPVTVDMVEKLPVPFGLVRWGVAPDHPEVKSVQNDFSEVAEDARFSFLGNVKVGGHVSLDDLRENYDAVVLAYGAESDRHLGIPGENLQGVFGASEFVNWYNGNPEEAEFPFPGMIKSDWCEDVAVIGLGNVGLDCARMLCMAPGELAKTDISTLATDALEHSKVKRVRIVGRRGHAQAAFTMKELRELGRMPEGSSEFRVVPAELEAGRTEATIEEIAKQRATKKQDALLMKRAAEQRPAEEVGPDDKFVELRFLLNPKEFVEDQQRPGWVGAVRCAVTRLEGEATAQRAVETDALVDLPAQLVVRSIGFRSNGLPGLPFDERRALPPSAEGRVLAATEGATLPGLYVTGWLKRGPSGIIGVNIADAKQTVKSVLADFEAAPVASGRPGGAAVRAALAEGHQVVDWEAYKRIDAVERRRGEATGKPRVKTLSVQEMLEIAADEK